jgi:hypothetical protein
MTDIQLVGLGLLVVLVGTPIISLVVLWLRRTR